MTGGDFQGYRQEHRVSPVWAGFAVLLDTGDEVAYELEGSDLAATLRMERVALDDGGPWSSRGRILLGPSRFSLWVAGSGQARSSWRDLQGPSHYRPGRQVVADGLPPR